MRFIYNAQNKGKQTKVEKLERAREKNNKHEIDIIRKQKQEFKFKKMGLKGAGKKRNAFA